MLGATHILDLDTEMWGWDMGAIMDSIDFIWNSSEDRECDEYGKNTRKSRFTGKVHEAFKTRELVTIACPIPTCTYFLDPHM